MDELDLSGDGRVKGRLAGGLLTVEGCGGGRLDMASSDTVFRGVAAAFEGGGVTALALDCQGVPANDYCCLALARACGGLCGRHGATMGFPGASEEVLAALAKLELSPDCAGVCLKPGDGVPVSVFITAANASIKFAKDGKAFLGFVGAVAASLAESVRNPRKVQWRETLYYMDKTGADAVPIICVICFLMGLILGFQGVVQMGKFGIDIFVADLVGLAIVKELGPLMVAMICTGRAGSAFAAEIGTMKVNEELDAMETMGLNAPRFLVIPKLLALAVVMPLLTVIGDVVGILGGMLVGVTRSHVSLPEYYGRTVAAIPIAGVFEGLLKSFVFAILIAGIGCLRGFESENNAKGVGGATTSSVVSGIFLVVLADAVITMLCN